MSFRAPLLCGLGVVFLASMPFAWKASAEDSVLPPGGIDPAAREAIAQMVEAYRGLASFTATVKTGSLGFPVPESTAIIDFKAPNRLSVQLTTKDDVVRGISDGKTVRVYHPNETGDPKTFPAPSTLSDTLQIMSATGEIALGPTARLVAGEDPLPSSGALKSLTLGPDAMAGDIPVQQVIALLEMGGQTAKLTYEIGKEDHLLRQSFLLLPGGRGVLTESYVGVRANRFLPDTLFAYHAPDLKSDTTPKPQPAAQPKQPAPSADSAPVKAGSLPPSTSGIAEDLNFSGYPGSLGSMKLGGDPLPLNIPDLNGRTMSLDQYRGKVVLIDFWATWCPPCRKEVPSLVQMYKKYHPYGFEIVGISLDEDLTALKTFTKEKEMTWRQYFDGLVWKNKVARRFNIHATPTTILVGRDGKIAAFEADGDNFEPLLRNALLGRPTHFVNLKN